MSSHRQRQLVLTSLAVFLVLCFFGTGTIKGGFFIDYHPPFTAPGRGEMNLWLAMLLFLAPAGLLVGVAFSREMAGVLALLGARLKGLDARERRLGLALLTLMVVLLSRAGNALVLDGFPITDDEWAAVFGGQVFLLGKTVVSVPFDFRAFPALFMWVKGSAVTSFDWLGTQFAWTLADLGLGHWVFAISAAIPVPALVWLMSRRLGVQWSVATAALFVLTPMATLLSVSTHGHLHSRGFVAVAVAAIWWLREERSVRSGALAGLAIGLGLLCRPFEVVTLLTPLVLLELVAAVRERGPRGRAVLVAVGVALLPIAIIFIHAQFMTQGWIPPRYSDGAIGYPIREPSLWVRFGSNAAYNFLRLALFSGGVFGLLLFLLGSFADDFTKALAAGVGLMTVLGLLHDNYGLHAVGPIHQSECVVPVVIVCLHGAKTLLTRTTALVASVAPLEVAAVVATSLLVPNAALLAYELAGLHGQARIQAEVYEGLEAAVPESERPAILFAPRFGQLWVQNLKFRERGSWVFEWRRPRPDFSDRLMILHDVPGVHESVRRAFPDRRLFRLSMQGAVSRLEAEAPPGPAPLPADAGQP